MNRYFHCFIIFLVVSLNEVEPHGYLSNPPARNAAWRYGFSVPANYDLMSLNCGGRGSKCSVCGDPFGSGYKPHETGGIYARQVIVKTYTMGSTIDIEVTITANHFGYFEFRVCPVTDNNVEVTQECLNQNQLVVNGNGFKRNLAGGEYATRMTVTLPEGLTCDRCVFQWYWNSTFTLEEYFNCADIRILTAAGVTIPITNSTITGSITSTSTSSVASTSTVIVGSGCKAEWDNRCTSHSQCCTGFCDNNNGAWAFGVCKISNVPTTTRPTTTIATTTSTLSTSTSRSATTNVSTTATTAPIGLQTLPLSATTTVSSKVRCFRGNGFCNYNLP